MKTDHRRYNQPAVSFQYAQRNNNRGQTLIEYVLIIVVISIVLITVMKFFQGSVSSTYNNAASSIPSSP